MQTGDAGKVIARITACWPRPPMDAAQIGIWVEHLERLDFDVAIKTCKISEQQLKRLPSFAEWREIYDEARHATPARVLGKPDCGICDDGWVEMPCDREWCPCTSPHHTVRPCPNGCVPMSRQERQARAERQDVEWSRRRRDGRYDKPVSAGVVAAQSFPVDSADRREAEDPDRF